MHSDAWCNFGSATMVVATSIQGFQFVQFVPHRFDQDTPAYSVTGVELYWVQCALYSVQYTVYSVQCTVYIVQFTVYSVQCIAYSVQFTVYM